MAPAVPFGFPNVMARVAVAQPVVFGPELVVVDAEVVEVEAVVGTVVVVAARMVVVVDEVDELPQAARPSTRPVRSRSADPVRRRRPCRSARRALPACTRSPRSGRSPFGVVMIGSSFDVRRSASAAVAQRP